MNDAACARKTYPEVSLVISNLNGKELLRDCLDSLFNQDYPGSYEIIVVDTGSTDGTPEMVAHEFPEVRLVEVNRMGIGKALNLGMTKAQGKIFAFDINNDEVFSQGWLRILVNALMNHTDAGVVGGIRILSGTKNVIDEAGVTFNYLGIPSSYINTRLPDMPDGPRRVDYVGAPLFQREMLEIVGMCDEEYVVYAEDEDFCARVKRAGYDVLVVPQAISYHKRSATLGKITALSLYYERRNHIRFIIKNFPLPRMFLALFWHVFLLTAIDASMCFPLMRKAFGSKQSRLFFLSKRAAKPNFRAVIEAILWNIRNFRSTIISRYQLPHIDRCRSQTHRNRTSRMCT